MTEQERREHFAFLNGVAADMKESRKEIIDLLEGIKAEIKQNSYPIVHGVNNHEQGMTVYGIMQVIDHHIKDYTE